jgi:hypothetical protein
MPAMMEPAQMRARCRQQPIFLAWLPFVGAPV